MLIVKMNIINLSYYLKKKYFIDKSNIIHEFNNLLVNDCNCVWITKFRRFSKSSIASMINAYYSKSWENKSKEIFDKLEISRNKYSNHNKSDETQYLSNLFNNFI